MPARPSREVGLADEGDRPLRSARGPRRRVALVRTLVVLSAESVVGPLDPGHDRDPQLVSSPVAQ